MRTSVICAQTCPTQYIPTDTKPHQTDTHTPTFTYLDQLPLHRQAPFIRLEVLQRGRARALAEPALVQLWGQQPVRLQGLDLPKELVDGVLFVVFCWVCWRVGGYVDRRSNVYSYVRSQGAASPPHADAKRDKTYRGGVPDEEALEVKLLLRRGHRVRFHDVARQEREVVPGVCTDGCVVVCVVWC